MREVARDADQNSRRTSCGGCMTRRRYAIDRQDRLGLLDEK